MYNRPLTLYQTTNFGLAQIKSICRRQIQCCLNDENIVGNEKMLVSSIFTFSQNVSKAFICRAVILRDFSGKEPHNNKSERP